MSTALLEVCDLSVRLGATPVLSGVSFEIETRGRVGLVGESGAGKSTLARALARLVPVSGGEVRFAGLPLNRLEGAALRALRRELQIIFQQPTASLDPHLTIGESVAEPLGLVRPALPRAARRQRVDELLARVGLGAHLAMRYPRELSGGECQRVAIARALAPAPRLLLCDEPVSALDVSIQGQIINLLADVNAQEGTALLLISHDLAVVRSLCERVIVLLAGRVLEVARTAELFAAPAHPYTRALIAALPVLEREGRSVSSPVAPDQSLPSPSAPPEASGCVYRARCPHAIDACARSVPVLEAVTAEPRSSSPGEPHRVACVRWRELRPVASA